MAEQKIWQVAMGRPRKIKDGAELWDKFIEYCQWVDTNPWQIKGTSTSMSSDGTPEDSGRRSARQDTKSLQRPYTLYGFCAFCGVCKWADFKNSHKSDEDFLEVILQIENVVKAYQVEGAMLRQFDGNIVSRLNGLADVQVNQVTVDDGIPKLNSEDIEALKRLNGLS